MVLVLVFKFFFLSISFTSIAPSLRLGAQALMQCSGLGKLRPNIVVIGFKNDWISDNIQKVEDYVNILHDAFEARLSVAILRTPSKAIKGFYFYH